MPRRKLQNEQTLWNEMGELGIDLGGALGQILSALGADGVQPECNHSATIVLTELIRTEIPASTQNTRARLQCIWYHIHGTRNMEQGTHLDLDTPMSQASWVGG